MLGQIFTTLTDAGQSFITFLTSLLNNVIAIFYTAPTVVEGTTVPGSLTDIGILTIAGIATSFVFFAIRWLTRLIKLRG